MKKATVPLLLCIILILSACGEIKSASRPVSASGSVSQILESAERERSEEQEPSVSAAPEEEFELSPDFTEYEPEPAPEPLPELSGDGIDIDLTAMSGTMIYAEVSAMVFAPEDYIGKIVRMYGDCVSMENLSGTVTYHAILITDAAACCAQGLEYVLEDESAYPEDGAFAIVTGRFETYDEDGYIFIHLVDAHIE